MKLSRLGPAGRFGRPVTVYAVVAVWLAAVGVGMTYLVTYEYAPGPSGGAHPDWPAETTIPLDRTRANLVMFAHPHCPCTRASIGELALLMARVGGRLAAQVVFLKPAQVPENWERTGLWRDAASIPGVVVKRDDVGREARRFGAATSGHVLLYSPQGRLLFSGGITKSRGHSGDNAGRSSIIALIAGARGTLTRTPAFGCSLRAQSNAN